MASNEYRPTEPIGADHGAVETADRGLKRSPFEPETFGEAPTVAPNENPVSAVSVRRDDRFTSALLLASRFRLHSHQRRTFQDAPKTLLLAAHVGSRPARPREDAGEARPVRAPRVRLRGVLRLAVRGRGDVRPRVPRPPRRAPSPRRGVRARRRPRLPRRLPRRPPRPPRSPAAVRRPRRRRERGDRRRVRERRRDPRPGADRRRIAPATPRRRVNDERIIAQVRIVARARIRLRPRARPPRRVHRAGERQSHRRPRARRVRRGVSAETQNRRR